ncbi:hypothetical protein [Candidatus Macondimonas diazotrophica]|uniref:Uncharacterized protein n=1 Tax=Candidatus Macondimonas diazotrophica TaxID=2305248 RepID=A0A4Z0F6G7_9GAMM|nr:hypothetical protein [Candidatus Macondimonas diazotrophica]TFZ81189.1 hypothetical protein E4680_13435 [Candidatus Macondimonas diazotrophica]
MTTAPWAHLPNAKHIDAVLADVNTRPEVWKAARDAAWDAAWIAARDAAWDAAWIAARSAARAAARSAAWDAARSVAWDAILALIAWDSAADLMDLSPDALRVLIDVAAPPVCHQAAMLLPWAVVRESQT